MAPKMMVALLLYAYCQGERSSPRIERLCEESVPYRVITGNEKPDHCSISRFRQDNAVAMKGLFIERLEAEEAQQRKLEERERKEAETGEKARGKPPKSVEDVRKEQEERKANVTAPAFSSACAEKSIKENILRSA